MAELREIPGMPLAWRACAALDGEGPPELVSQYVKVSNETLEGIAQGMSDPAQKQVLDEIRMFLRSLEQALRPAGDTRLRLVPGKRRGRPRKSRAEVRRGMTAAYLVKRLVADGWKQEAAVAEIGKQTDIGRTELFHLLRRSRKFDQALSEIHLE